MNSTNLQDFLKPFGSFSFYVLSESFFTTDQNKQVWGKFDGAASHFGERKNISNVAWIGKVKKAVS